MMDAIDELSQLADLMKQAVSLLADEDPDETTSSKRSATFLNVVALGNVPTGENGATRAPIILDLSREGGFFE